MPVGGEPPPPERRRIEARLPAARVLHGEAGLRIHAPRSGAERGNLRRPAEPEVQRRRGSPREPRFPLVAGRPDPRGERPPLRVARAPEAPRLARVRVIAQKRAGGANPLRAPPEKG